MGEGVPGGGVIRRYRDGLAVVLIELARVAQAQRRSPLDSSPRSISARGA